MIKLLGELESENKMKVHTISYSGNSKGVEVEEVLQGEGTHYVNPITGEQWYEESAKEKNDKKVIEELENKINELSNVLNQIKEK
ncbi:MAG: hypothetical protein ACOCRK_07115 [bacterium]